MTHNSNSILVKSYSTENETTTTTKNKTNNHSKPSTIIEAKKILKSQTIPHNYYSSLTNSINTTNRNTNRNSISNFSHVNYYSFRTAESARFNPHMYVNSRPQNQRYSTSSYTPSYNYRLENRYKHYSLRDYPQSGGNNMKTSITLPAISNRTINTTNPVYSSQKGSYSSTAIRLVCHA